MASVIQDAGLPSEEALELIDFHDLEIEREVGRGTFGVVHKATYFGADVAVKQFKTPEGDTGDFEKYLKREIYVQKNVRHPNIVQFVGYSRHQNENWLVTQYVSGGNLHKYLKDKNNEFPWHMRLKLARDIAYAMAFLHSKKILYRDLKAKNALVEFTQEGGMRGLLCDFGFARSVRPATLTRKQAGLTICGTDSFMAPEVILGIPYDEKADVYSFGVLVLELITRVKVRNVLQRRPQDGFDYDKSDVVKHLPGDCLVQFAQLFFSCCEYRPQVRPTFKEIIATLTNVINSYDGQQTIIQAPPGGGVLHRQPSLSNIINNFNITNGNPNNAFYAPSQNKFTELQSVLITQIDSILQYVNVLSNEMSKIKTEQDALKVKNQCKAIVEIKETLLVLSDTTDAIDYPTPPQMTPTPGLARIALLKQNMSISLLEISMNLRYLRDLINDGREYTNLVTIGKTIREIKKMLVSL